METDLLGKFKSYEDRCMVLSNVTKEQMKQYAVCNEDFNEIQRQINQIEHIRLYSSLHTKYRMTTLGRREPGFTSWF